MDKNQVSGGLFAGMTIDYKRVMYSLWENILVIILAALICGGAFFGYTYFFTTPKYSSSVLVYINKSSVSISGAELVLSSGEKYVETYTTLLSSRTTLEEIAETAGVSYSPSELREMISTTSSTNSSFLTITVSCGSPTEAELIANTIASVLPTRVSDIVEGTTLRVVDYAVVPSSRSTTSLSRNFFIGVAVGALLVAAIVVFKEIVETNHAPMINSVSDLTTHYADYPVLGVIRDLSYADSKYRHSETGYGKYSDYYKNKGVTSEKKTDNRSDRNNEKSSEVKADHKSESRIEKRTNNRPEKRSEAGTQKRPEVGTHTKSEHRIEKKADTRLNNIDNLADTEFENGVDEKGEKF